MSATNSRVLLLGTEPSDGTAVTGVTTGTSVPLDASKNAGIRSFFFTSIGTTSGGTILIEEADWNPDKQAPYSGTWSQIQSIAASSFTGGAQSAVHLSDTAYAFVRVRISPTITGGGSITVVTRTRSSF